MDTEKEKKIEEYNKIIEKQEKLSEKLLLLPKGHVNVLYRGGKGYYYLTYRDGYKVKNDYLGPADKTDLNNIFQQLTERENCKKEIRRLKEEAKNLKKEIGRIRKNAIKSN